MALRRAQLASALLIALAAVPAQANEVGRKGAEVYCFMRESGNPCLLYTSDAADE